jgi:predicted Zn-dependent protease with MMP-like domain
MPPDTTDSPLDITDEQFEDMIGQALDELPQDYVNRLLKDVAVTWANEPTPEQRHTLKLRQNDSLFGLYEGLPLTGRYSGMTKITPDKITIFKQPIVSYVHDMPGLKDQIKRTVWHEMAHFFGLDHPRIHELE